MKVLLFSIIIIIFLFFKKINTIFLYTQKINTIDQYVSVVVAYIGTHIIKAITEAQPNKSIYSKLS